MVWRRSYGLQVAGIKPEWQTTPDQVQVGMDIHKGLVAFYRNLFVEKLKAVVSVEHGLVSRAQALNEIRHMIRQLRIGLPLGQRTLYLSDIFDPMFNWWYAEHQENMLRQCEKDCLLRGYEDMMHEMVFFNDEAVGEGAISAPRIRNDLRQAIDHGLQILLSRESSPDDIKAARRRLESKVARAVTLDSIGYRMDVQTIQGLFEETLLRRPNLLQRYLANQQFGPSINNQNGHDQLHQILEACDVPPIEINLSQLYPGSHHDDAASVERNAAGRNEEVRHAQKALISILDAVNKQQISLAGGARSTQDLAQRMQDVQRLISDGFARYQGAIGKEESEQHNRFHFNVLQDAISDLDAQNSS